MQNDAAVYQSSNRREPREVLLFPWLLLPLAAAVVRPAGQSYSQRSPYSAGTCSSPWSFPYFFPCLFPRLCLCFCGFHRSCVGTSIDANGSHISIDLFIYLSIYLFIHVRVRSARAVLGVGICQGERLGRLGRLGRLDRVKWLETARV